MAFGRAGAGGLSRIGELAASAAVQFLKQRGE
jgi:hypothetical protein